MGANADTRYTRVFAWEEVVYKILNLDPMVEPFAVQIKLNQEELKGDSITNKKITMQMFF